MPPQRCRCQHWWYWENGGKGVKGVINNQETPYSSIDLWDLKIGGGIGGGAVVGLLAFRASARELDQSVSNVDIR